MGLLVFCKQTPFQLGAIGTLIGLPGWAEVIYNVLALSQTSLVSAVQVFFKKNCRKGRYRSYLAISPFPTDFSTRFENFLPFSSNLKLSSKESFSLEEAKIGRLGTC